MTVLRGITWNHSRGFVSVVATAQRFCEMRPDVDIIWQKRSLQEFADAPIEDLAEDYDLLVIDHPWAGFAAYSQVLVPLQEIMPAEYMQDQADNSVGHSHPSYIFDGGQCALAIDAATPVASYRPDLLERYGTGAAADLARSAGFGAAGTRHHARHPDRYLDELLYVVRHTRRSALRR